VLNVQMHPSSFKPQRRYSRKSKTSRPETGVTSGADGGLAATRGD